MLAFPFLLIPLAIFNIVVFLMPGVAFTAPVFSVPLMSGAVWTVTLSDILLILSVALLLCEIVKAARAGGRYLTDHLLSFLVLAVAVAEFVLLAPFGTSPFFLLCALAFVDVTAGLALHRQRSRHAAAAPTPQPAPPPAPVAAPAPAPNTEPTPAPVTPPAAAEPGPDIPPDPRAQPSLGSLVPGVAPPPAASDRPAPKPPTEPPRP